MKEIIKNKLNILKEDYFSDAPQKMLDMVNKRYENIFAHVLTNDKFNVIMNYQMLYNPAVSSKANQCETNVFKFIKENPNEYYPVGGFIIDNNFNIIEHWWVYNISNNKHVEITPFNGGLLSLKGYVGIINKDINSEIVKANNFYDISFLKGGHVYNKYFKPMLNESMELIDEDYPVSFNMEEFKTFRTFAQRMRYCTQHLQKLASGSSRTVFKIDDKMVLKLAKNPKGLAQNETEIEWGKNGYYSQILAKTIENDPNNLWVEMELARKCKPSDFFRIVGFKIEFLWSFLTNRVNEKKGKRGLIQIPQEIKDKIDDSHFINVLLNFIDDSGSEINQTVAGDYSRLSSYGIVDRGHGDEVVIIDYGLTGDVASSYYS